MKARIKKRIEPVNGTDFNEVHTYVYLGSACIAECWNDADAKLLVRALSKLDGRLGEERER